MGEWKEVYRGRNALGGNMRVGSLVKHKDYDDIGVVIWVGEFKIIFIRTDGHKWNTYPFQVEVICK